MSAAASVTLRGKTKVAIIGAGPAGMAAALQLKREGIDFILFERDANGSLLKNAWQVENYLGSKDTSGVDLIASFREHLTRNEITFHVETIQRLSFDHLNSLFTLASNKELYQAERVIVASGTKPKSFSLLDNLPQELTAHVFSDVFTLLTAKSKTIVILGAGDAAFDNSLYLAANHNKIYLINRSSKAKCLPKLYKLALTNQNITYLENSSLYCLKKGQSKNLQYGLLQAKNEIALEADCLLLAIGRLPQKDFYSAEMYTQEKMLIAAKKLYLIGDVQNENFRQIGIAVGDGIKAAMQVAKIGY